MNLTAFISALLIAAGAAIMLLALRPATRIIAELPEGAAKARWNTLRALIVLFLIGYLGALALLPGHAGIPHLIEGGVFLAGAVFVLMVTRLMLSTTRDVRRITKLELENVTDPLLGIYNRRYMEQRLQEEVSRANRYMTPLSLCIIDIDDFKRVNDSFGHPVGDKVLRRLSDLLRERMRDVDLFARYGGEEFVVLLPNTGAEEAAVFADRMRQLVEEASLASTAEGIPDIRCTVSIGVTTSSRGKLSGAELLREADDALYKAKNGGRNRVMVHATATQGR